MDTDSGLLAGDRALTLDALALRARRAAAALAALGVDAGARVALLLRNDIPFIEATQGAALLGASTVPLNWHLTPPEVGHILRDCGARVLLAHADLLTVAMQAELAAARVEMLAVDTPPELRAAYRLDGSPPGAPTARRWNDWIAGFEPWPAAPMPIRAAMFYTSGTSGVPKGVQRSADVPPEVALAAQRRSLRAWSLEPVPGTPPPRAVMTGPLYHSAPNAYALAVLRAGGLLVLQPRFDPAELLALIERHRITHLHLVPTMFVRLLALPEAVRHRHDLSSLKAVVHGAAPCPPDVKRRMIAWWGPVIDEYYAMTETGIIAASTSEQWLRHPGTVGCAADGVQIRIADDEGRELPAGGVGEICLRSATTDHVSYHGDDAKTRELRRDGFLRTGDVGWLSEDGFLFISDRRSDLVISGGVNIYPAEVEAQLLALPGIRDAAVFGLPDAEMGERLVAALVVDGAPPQVDELRARLGERLAAYKLPREFRFDLELPREDTGKVRKRALRDAWLAGAGR